jgi:hypothetical protein
VFLERGNFEESEAKNLGLSGDASLVGTKEIQKRRKLVSAVSKRIDSANTKTRPSTAYRPHTAVRPQTA